MGGAGKIQWTQLLTSTFFSLAMVDVIFADVAQPDQTRIVALNAHTFLRNGGHFVISIKVRGFISFPSIIAKQPVKAREPPSLRIQSIPSLYPNPSPYKSSSAPK